MGNNEVRNASIRAKLLERCEEFGLSSPAEIQEDCFEDYEEALTSKEFCYTGKALALFLEWIRSLPLTPEELTYIHENLPRAAWDKLGLELPKVKLDYTTPVEPLPDEQVTWLRESVEAGKCLPHGGVVRCSNLCYKWTGRRGIHMCAGGMTGTKPEYLAMFSEILRVQIPFTVAVLSEEERELVIHLIQRRNKSYCNVPGGGETCRNVCDSLAEKVFGFGKEECLHWRTENQHTRIIAILEHVLREQEDLLPPHEVVQFGWEKFATLNDWHVADHNDCPRDYGLWDRADCRGIFTAIPEVSNITGEISPTRPHCGKSGGCPCAIYAKENVRTVTAKCLALGVKFEEYPIWVIAGELEGEKLIITKQIEDNIYFDLPSSGMGSFNTRFDAHLYTKTPPAPKEEFVKYLAVVVNGDADPVSISSSHDHGSLKLGSIITITGEIAGVYSYTSKREIGDNADWWWKQGEVIRITNPAALHEMLHKLDGGEAGMVEKIKARCREYASKGYTNYQGMLSFIADLEGKAK